MDFAHILIHKTTKSEVSRVRTRLGLLGGNTDNTAQTQQFRAAVRSSVSHYCSGRDMERVHLEFSGDACIKILAHRLRHLTYLMKENDFGPTLTLLRCHTHSVIL